MPERFVDLRHRRRRLVRLAGAALLLGAAGAAGACTEQYDGGEACPVLCPATNTAFRDTVLDAVSFDTAIAGFPALGLSSNLLLANRPDTLVTRAVIRLDVLPTAFRPNNGTDTASITAIDSVYLRLQLDTTGRRGTTPVTLQVFDVDTAASDSVQSVIRSLFRPDRLLGSLTITPSATGDSLRVPLSRAAVLAKIRSQSRLRLGLRLTGGSAQLRLIAFQFFTGAGAPSVLFDPSSDTLYAPIIVNTGTSITGAPADVALSYQVYSIVDRGSSAPDATTLVVGGFPAYRTYLRVTIPPRIIDSATIVRAEVLLTQRPSAFGNVGDSVSIVPLVPASSASITDFRRILDLSVEGIFAALDTTRFLPRDSGVRAVNVLPLVRSWPSYPANVPRALAFRINGEGSQPAELRFFSSEAAPNLRPRIRITYLPRIENAIP